MPLRLLTGVLLLTAALARVQPLRAPEPTVELVLATSESQARVVGRALRSGIFVDQLLIPEPH